MAVKVLRIVLPLFLTSVIQGRILKLNSSDDDFISDGIDHVEDYSSSLGLLAPSQCDHQYGFLPCAENAAGYIFQIIVYQGLLIFGEKLIGKGSKVLFNIIGAGKFGGIIFRILMSLPSMMLMIVSGVFSPKENAQSQVSLGVGIFAGMTVFSLTIQWGMCLIVGRRNFLYKPDTDQTAVSNSICLQAKEKLTLLKETGVTIDSDTKRTAGIMLLSLIPYIIVQLDDIFNNSFGNSAVNLIALCVASLSLLLYFAYQIFNPWIQERSLDYSKYELLRKGFLQHMEQHGQLLTDHGKLNTEVITKLFSDTDKNADKNITKLEMEKLVLDIIQTGKVEVDESFAVSEVMKTFDFDDDRSISEQEFINGCKRWIDETNQSSNNNDASSKYIFNELCQLFKDKKEDDPQEIDRIMSKILMHCETQLLKSEALVTADGKPNIERIKTLFEKFDSDGNKSISKSELHQLISTVKFGDFKPKYEDVVKELFKDFDKDGNSIIDEPEFVEGVSKWLNKAIRVAESRDTAKSIDKFDEMVWEKKAFDKWALIISVFQVLLGIVMLTFLGGPLMGSILQLSFAMNFPSFTISFVVVPLAMNARSLIAALLPASHKSERTASLTFSEIYGGVVMNNLAGLLTLLAIVYAKDLTFDFAAEVMTIMVVCAIIGILAYTQTTYPLWTSILAFLLFPLSLGLFYFMQILWSWN